MNKNKWIIGKGTSTYDNYIIHTEPPYFIASINILVPKGSTKYESLLPEKTDEFDYTCLYDGDNLFLTFTWLDRLPKPDKLIREAYEVADEWLKSK